MRARALRCLLWLLLLNDEEGVCVGDCVDLVPAPVQPLRPDVNLKAQAIECVQQYDFSYVLNSLQI